MSFSIKNEKYIIILLYVDDIIITGNVKQNIQKLKVKMMSEIEMTDLGDARMYLGVELHYYKQEIYFHQQKYITKLLERFNLTYCKPLDISMNPNSSSPRKLTLQL